MFELVGLQLEECLRIQVISRIKVVHQHFRIESCVSAAFKLLRLAVKWFEVKVWALGDWWLASHFNQTLGSLRKTQKTFV